MIYQNWLQRKTNMVKNHIIHLIYHFKTRVLNRSLIFFLYTFMYTYNSKIKDHSQTKWYIQTKIGLVCQIVFQI